MSEEQKGYLSASGKRKVTTHRLLEMKQRGGEKKYQCSRRMTTLWLQ